VAAALLLAETSVATARIRAASGGHGNRNHGITETASRPTAADPYYRLSDRYYGYSDPYRGLYDFYAVPPALHSGLHLQPRETGRLAIVGEHLDG
jgi:hypothetical protein